MNSPDITLLGAGKMGAAFVDRWVAAGRSIIVWNRTFERAQALACPGVAPVEDLVDAVRRVPLVVSMLTDGVALRSVMIDHGAIAAMSAGSCLVDLSTVDIASSEAVADKATHHGVLYLRGAVSGTPSVVRAGASGLLLSGPTAAYDAARAVLTEITDLHVVLGDREESRVVKLAVNLILAGTMELLAEAMVMSEASGVPREVLLDALDSTVISSRFLTYKAAALRARDYSATFRAVDMYKDVSLAVDQASSAGIPMPTTLCVRDQLAAVCSAGWADDDFMAVTRLLQNNGSRPVD
jgi:3-hydroxyisobutyrate dehydrogenase-like beta-hydroxyacid dehydrogenase